MNSINITKNVITSAIGYRADNGTVSAEVSLDISLCSAETINAILERGLYSLAAEYKTSGNVESEYEFTALMQGFAGDKIEEFATRERKRGKTAQAYPQQMRVMDATTLEKLQSRALRFNRFIPLPATPSVAFSKLVSNKYESELRTMDLYNVATEWKTLLGSSDVVIDTTARKAMESLTDWLSEIGNPAFTS